jgi:dihydrofolate reductase
MPGVGCACHAIVTGCSRSGDPPQAPHYDATVGSTQYYLAQSLDGYIAESDGGLDWLLHYDGEGGADASQATEGGYDRFFADVGALAMGSATYQFVLDEGGERWPYEGRPSWVFTSRDLPVPEGADVRFARGPVGPPHAEMRAAAGDRNVWIVGGGHLGLLDELLITVVPVVLGDGIPTLPGRLRQRLRLTGTQPFRNGMVELRYDLLR